MIPQDPPAIAFLPQVQSIALQYKILTEYGRQEATSSEVDQNAL